MPTKRTRSFGKVVSVFAVSNLTATGLRLVGGLLTTRLVEPATLGLFNSIGLVQGYAPFIQLGIGNGLNRNLPYHIGRGDRQHANILVAATFWWSLVTAFGAGCILASIGAWQAATGRPDLAFAWWSFAVVVFCTLFSQFFLRSQFRSGGDFMRLSRVQLAGGCAALVLVLLVWQLDWWGLCLRAVGVALVPVVLMWFWRPFRVWPRFDKPALFELAKTGLPIFAVGQVNAWWVTLNSTLVLAYAGKTGLGLYALANLAGPTLALLPHSLASVIYPRMSASWGQDERIETLVQMAVKPTVWAILVTTVATAAAWLALPTVASTIVPKYVDGIPAAQWALAAAGVLSLSPINSVFNVTMKQGRYGAAVLSGMLFYVAVLHFLLSDGVELADFPKALLFGRLFFLVTCFLMIWRLVIAERVHTVSGSRHGG